MGMHSPGLKKKKPQLSFTFLSFHYRRLLDGVKQKEA